MYEREGGGGVEGGVGWEGRGKRGKVGGSCSEKMYVRERRKGGRWKGEGRGSERMRE